jgi:chloramphenicol 3-O-phosphotransferase
VIIVLNGPLGIGKSTLAEALMESIDGCVMLDGDRLIAVNPLPENELEHLHSTVALLVAHHQRFGYRHFIVDYIWRSTAELTDLQRRLERIDADFRAFLLTLPAEENLRRIVRRASLRAIDEIEFERRTYLDERAILDANACDLGEPFDVSAPPAELVEAMLKRLGFR